jgi:hypothetical protein
MFCTCAAIVMAALPALPLGAVDDVSMLLERGKPVERALSGGESHTYRIALGAGECAIVIAEQRGIDVSVRVTDPSGNSVADFDAESRPRGRERVEIVADEAATYQITVSARYPYDPAGAYQLRLDDIHLATDRDRRLDEARRLFTAMEPLRAAGKYADAAYYGGLKQGLGRGDALRQAQLAMMTRPNRQHPFYWSSFIQAGEWANLDGKRAETSSEAWER